MTRPPRTTFRRVVSTLGVSLALALGIVGASNVASAQTDGDTDPTETVPPDPVAPPDGDIPAPITFDDEQVVDSWALTPEGADASNRVDLSYSASPGDTIEDIVTIWNLGTRGLTFDLYATDAFNNADGTYALLASDVEPTGVGTWVTFEQDQITVPPGTRANLPITITVPADARPGDHAGGLLAANTVTDLPEEGGDVSAQINLERRTGTRINVNVAGPTRVDVGIENLSIDYGASANPFGGTSTVAFRIQNRGNVRVEGDYLVGASTIFGLGEQTTDGTFPELLPGQGIDLVVEIDGVPAFGRANADVTVTPATVDPEANQVSSSTGTFAMPITLILFLLLLILGAALWWRLRRHREEAERVEVVEFVAEKEMV